jgi:uncharacterized protein
VAEEELTIVAADVELRATVTLPSGPVRGAVVALHPASDGSRRQLLFEHLAAAVAPRGVAVLRFDRRPSSTGGDVPLAVQAADALEALRALRARPEIGDVPLGLWAWSQGAWAAALAAARSSEVRFLVLLAASGVSPAEQMRYGTAEQLRRRGYGDRDLSELAELRAAVEETLRGRTDPAAAQAVIDRYADRAWFPLAYVPRSLSASSEWPDMDFDPEPVVAELRCPVLLFYGDDDEWTPVEPSISAWRRAAAAGGNAEPTVVRLRGATHGPTLAGRSEPDAISPEYTRVLVDWIDRRLP